MGSNAFFTVLVLLSSALVIAGPTTWRTWLDPVVLGTGAVLSVRSLRQRFPWQNIVAVISLTAGVTILNTLVHQTESDLATPRNTGLPLFTIMSLGIFIGSRETARQFLVKRLHSFSISQRRANLDAPGLWIIGLGTLLSALPLFLAGWSGLSPWDWVRLADHDTLGYGRPWLRAGRGVLSCLLTPFLWLLITTPWFLPKYASARNPGTGATAAWCGLTCYLSALCTTPVAWPSAAVGFVGILVVLVMMTSKSPTPPKHAMQGGASQTEQAGPRA